MQTQRNLTNLCSQIFVVLQACFILLVIFGSVLLLAAPAIILELHLAEFARVTLPATHQFVEGPPDSITTFIRVAF